MSKVIAYQDTSEDGRVLSHKGSAAFLDLDQGYVYDAAGNQIARWSPKDNEETQALAEYCADYSLQLSANSTKAADPERAQAMLMAGRAQISGDDSDAILMDLGPSDVHVTAALPNFASGYKNFTPMADVVLPPLLVDKQVNTYFQFAKEDAFQRAIPNMGAGGAQVGEIAPRLATDSYSCIERALGGFVTTQVEANADAPLRIRQATSNRIMNALLLEREIRSQAKMRTTSNWNSAQVTTIAAGSQWNGGPGSDPVKDLHTMLENSFGEVTGLLYPEPVWHAFVRNPAVRAYYAYKSNSASVPTPGQMQAILDLPPIYVAKMKYINASGTLSYVWGSDVVAFRQPAEMPPTSQEDVATAYTFRWKYSNVKDGVSAGGFTVREFFVQDRGTAGGNKIVVLHSDDERFTSKYIGGLLVNATQ